MRSTLLAALLLLLPLPLAAHEFKVGDITIDHPWARATPGAAPNGAVFMTLENEGGQADSLIAAESDAAQKVELHSHTMVDGVMQMRPVESIEVPAGGETKLQPGGLHIMLLGLVAPLQEGERVPMTLIFQKAGKVEVSVAVEAVGSMGMDHSGSGHKN